MDEMKQVVKVKEEKLERWAQRIGSGIARRDVRGVVKWPMADELAHEEDNG